MKKKLMLFYKFGFAALVFAAILEQIRHLMQAGIFNPFNFFSFFTVESNIFGAVLFVASAIALWRGKTSSILSYLRGAAALYMIVTGIVYVSLLAGVEVQTSVPWVNVVLHYLFPVVALLDWLIDQPRPAVAPKRALFWIAFPAAYVGYSLVRGAVTHWYPYPFVNAAEFGYLHVAVNCAVIAGGVGLLAPLLAWLTLPRRKR